MVVAPDTFHTYFQKIYDSRWSGLYESLFSKEAKVQRLNLWSQEGELRLLETHNDSVKIMEVHLEEEQLRDKSQMAKAYILSSSGVATNRSSTSGLLETYSMDPASITAALCLTPQEGENLLDLCAAPGGKTLVLFEALVRSGELQAVELSESRKENLIKIVKQYVPQEPRKRLWVKGGDGVSFAYRHQNSYDKVLVDVPCSGERHLLQNPKELEAWSIKRSEKLAQRQYALLCNAFMALKPGGSLVYSTCSINPIENDKVIEKFMNKKEQHHLCQNFQFNIEVQPEKTEFGFQYLPDIKGWGPLYFARITKLDR